jgi:hypothetical protein
MDYYYLEMGFRSLCESRVNYFFEFLKAVNLGPSELLYSFSHILNKTSKSTDKLYIF